MEKCERNWGCPRESCAPGLRNGVLWVGPALDRRVDVGDLSNDGIQCAQEIQGNVWCWNKESLVYNLSSTFGGAQEEGVLSSGQVTDNESPSE